MKLDQLFGYLPTLFTFRGSDSVFLPIKIVTALLCLPWPLTIVASAMSLAGHAPQEIPQFKIYLMRFTWLLVLVYPLAFFATIFFAEKILASRSYWLAVVISLTPIVLSCTILVWIFSNPIVGVAQSMRIVKVDIKALGPDGLPIIFWKMKQDDSSAVVRLLDAGADIEAKGYNGSTPILAAAIVNNWTMVELLMKRGANTSIVDKRGFNLPYLITQAKPLEGTETDKALTRIRDALRERGMLEKPYEPAQIRELMKNGKWPP